MTVKKKKEAIPSVIESKAGGYKPALPPQDHHIKRRPAPIEAPQKQCCAVVRICLQYAGVTISTFNHLWRIGSKTEDLIANYRDFDDAG